MSKKSIFYVLKQEYDGQEYSTTRGEIIPLYSDDAFTKDKDGTYTKHTGICVTGFKIPDNHLRNCEGRMVMLGGL